MARVLKNVPVGDQVFLLEVKLEYTEDIPAPGEFYMIRAWDMSPLLNRPLSVFDYDRDKHTISFLYSVRGEGTNILSRVGVGSDINLHGPYGNPFFIDDHKNLCLVGGGIGIAPLYYTAKYFKEFRPDISIRAYLGFPRTVYALDNFYNVCDEVDVLIGGFITDRLKVKRNENVLCCGPSAMMNKVAEIVPAENSVYMSLESRMACGLGACLGCVTKAPLVYKETLDPKYNEFFAPKQVKICTEGPIFKREVLDLDA